MSLVKEIILSLVSCLVVLIALSIGFYRFIPNNKVIPETVSYQASEEIKNELNSEVEKNSESIVKTYEITNNDMENYNAKKEYVPGKKNPFAPVDTSSDTDSTDDDASSVITTPGGNSNSSGSLFEKPGTK